MRPEIDLLSNCGQESKKTVCFYYIRDFFDEENIVIYAVSDCGTPF